MDLHEAIKLLIAQNFTTPAGAKLEETSAFQNIATALGRQQDAAIQLDQLKMQIRATAIQTAVQTVTEDASQHTANTLVEAAKVIDEYLYVTKN